MAGCPRGELGVGTPAGACAGVLFGAAGCGAARVLLHGSEIAAGAAC